VEKLRKMPILFLFVAIGTVSAPLIVVSNTLIL